MSMTASVLPRRLKLHHVVFMGLAYMSPFAVFDTFGIVTESTGGFVPGAYVVVAIAILFTALSYGKMVKIYPVAGSAYAYTRHTMGSGTGFFVGWAVLLDYMFLPMINALLAGIYLGASFPDVPTWVWVVGLLAIISALNIAGIKITATANIVMALFQLVVAIIFVVLTIRAILADSAAEFTFAPFYAMDLETAGLFAGASILALAFLGFDAVTTLSEEAIEPKKTMPRAIFLIALLGALFFITVTYFMQSLFPDAAALQEITNDLDGASPHIALYIGGVVFQTIFLSGAVISVLSSGLASQASTSRLLFAMGRDKVLNKRIFGYVHPRLQTPVVNIIITGMVGLGALMMDLDMATSLINFGAFSAFAFVNLSVIVYHLRNPKFRSARGWFNWILLPLIGFLINAYLWISLNPIALTIGLGWIVLGFGYLLYLTKFFTVSPPKIAYEDVD